MVIKCKYEIIDNWSKVVYIVNPKIFVYLDIGYYIKGGVSAHTPLGVGTPIVKLSFDTFLLN